MSVSNEQGYQIFISYRRKGSDAHARVFYEKLKGVGYSVFLDFESLGSGGFKEDIIKAIEGCEDFILLLPEDGLERCKTDDNDLLREEIEKALEYNKNIIPVFINDFEMPKEDDLPEKIAPLVYKNGIRCSMEYFNAVFSKLLRTLSLPPRNADIYVALNRLKDKMELLNHGYFKSWASIKLEGFLSENRSFFDGTCSTHPHAEDTFGITGIGFTRKSIKALSSLGDYWEDSFAPSYIKKQVELKNKSVEITRIFVLDDINSPENKNLMSRQANLGFNIYYIEKNNPYVNPEWLAEDYLIQDDELLVQISCITHEYDPDSLGSEEITTDSYKVRQKLMRFERILERATQFTVETSGE